MKKDEIEPILIKSVEEVGLERWFEVGPVPADRAGAVAALAKRMRGPEAARHVRWVVLRGDVVLARISARRDEGGRFTLYWPTWREGLSRAERVDLGTKVLNRLVDLAQGEGFRYAECKPADDVAGFEEWISLLEAASFLRVSAAHLLELRVPASWEGVAGSGVVAGDEVSVEELEGIFLRYQSATSDGADADSLPDRHASFMSLFDDPGLDTDQRRWRVCRHGDVIVGFVAVGVERNANEPERDGWILSIGVVPEHRRHGYGRELLAAALESLRVAGATRILALVDDQNEASLALHHRAGFSAQPTRFWVYRRALV